LSYKKSILITGVSGGIGSAIAIFFKEKGYEVYGIDIENTLQDGIVDEFFQIDLNKLCQDENYRTSSFNQIKTKVNKINVLINNAAVQILDSFQNIKWEDWMSTFNVNVNSAFLLSQFFSSDLIANQGSIINIGSIHNELTKPEFIAYATSKSALVGLTKAMAVDLKDKIRVNCISPAAIETDMLRAGFNNDENSISKLKFLHPSQTIGKPSDIAELCYFLVSKNITFLHGANFKIDGGISSVLHDL